MMLRKGATGSSLTEVLLASMVVATGVLSLLTLQTYAYGIGLQARHRQQASLLLLELNELAQLDIELFQDIDLSALMHTDLVTDTCSFGSVCPVQVFVSSELVLWSARVRQSLPDANIEMLTDVQQGQAVFICRLTWHGPELFAQNTMEVMLPR